MRLRELAELHFVGLADLLWPRRCLDCGAVLTLAEKHLCAMCHAQAEWGMNGAEMAPLNDVHLRLMPERVERAAVMTEYSRHGRGAHMIHIGKYQGRPSVLRYLAREYASQLLDMGFFEGMDGVQPVPMPWVKLFRRGYNQAREIALSVSQVTGLPLQEHLKAFYHTSQTRRNAFMRFTNVGRTYAAADAENLDGRHLLMVDDVVTSGSTMLACIRALRRVSPGLKVSIFALGIARSS